MTLVVEDGTGLANADAYVSIADANTYHAKFGSPDAWAKASDDCKESAIRSATQYLDIEFGSRWFGFKASQTQALAFPRKDVVTRDGYCLDEDSVPQAVKDATAEMALRHLQDDNLLPDIAAEINIKSERIKVGPIEEEIEYTGEKDPTKNFVKVERMLGAASLIVDSGEVVRG